MFKYIYIHFIFFKDFIYLSTRDTERERQRHRQRDEQAPCRDPDVGLNLRTPGSRPERKADTQPLSHPGAHNRPNLNGNFVQLTQSFERNVRILKNQ